MTWSGTQHPRCSGAIVVYRIHFTAQDLARTRVAETPMPLIELTLAARALQDRSQPVRLDAWRRRACARLSTQARMALSLIPPVGWSPGFIFRPLAGSAEESLERVRAVPRTHVAEALTFIAERQPVPSWAHQLADDAALYKQFVDGLASLNAILLGPYEARLTDLFMADRTVRMRQFLNGGIEHLLAQLNPQWLWWNPPVLEVRMANGIDFDLRLEGHGVLLVPSMFGTRSLVDDDWPAAGQPQPIITYPAGHDRPLNRLTTFAPGASKSRSAISALLGNTRAAVLTTIAEHPGCSTKELAALAGIAAASASEHATILRQAGLINTVRHRNTAIHSPTKLGIALLNRP
jgi:DNA-binding transcriptional ArsR family regulator